jgi:hypothetical protein
MTDCTSSAQLLSNKIIDPPPVITSVLRPTVPLSWSRATGWETAFGYHPQVLSLTDVGNSQLVRCLYGKGVQARCLGNFAPRGPLAASAVWNLKTTNFQNQGKETKSLQLDRGNILAGQFHRPIFPVAVPCSNHGELRRSEPNTAKA